MDTWCSHKRHLVISPSQFYPDDHFLGISYVNPVSSFVPPVRTKQHRLSIPKLINCNLWNHWNGFKTSFSSMFHTAIRPQRSPVALNTVNPLQGGNIRPSLTERAENWVRHFHLRRIIAWKVITACFCQSEEKHVIMVSSVTCFLFTHCKQKSDVHL